ncbi:hypothetical protein GX51_02701 [Blastomyces parvus]|uniref:C2H2-type domain-containing protein n=1 Tax=Blastomyces parvus TaxID=2060905 RepID=A0A2B7XAL5_9EURO|nr:hypothetical protein GX51_02701 [Blastomyces parvus]
MDALLSNGIINDPAYGHTADSPSIELPMHLQPVTVDFHSIPPTPVDTIREPLLPWWPNSQPASWMIEAFPPQENNLPQLIQNIDYPLPATRDVREIELVGDSQSSLPRPTEKIDQSPNVRNTGSQRAVKSEPLPVQCSEHGCGRTFSDRACLLRHRREVHKISTRYKTPGTYPCPIVECPRHTKTFARLWNLHNHMKVHRQESERLQPTRVLFNHARRRPKAARGSELSEADSPILNISDRRSPPQSLQAKLECLLEERNKLDEKISALRNAQRIVEDMN